MGEGMEKGVRPALQEGGARVCSLNDPYVPGNIQVTQVLE
jgi:hypothetical protein